LCLSMHEMTATVAKGSLNDVDTRSND